MKNISNDSSATLRSLNSLSTVALVAIMLLVAPVAGFAQGTASSIRGKIYDQNGNAVTGTSVVVEDMRTGVQREYTSNNSGAFYASNLPVGGPYEVTVAGAEPVIVASVALGDTYNLTINLEADVVIEEIVVTGTTSALASVTTGPAATYSIFDLESAVAFERDITGIYSLDPRLNLDVDGFSINCGGQHPRFNSVTLDGVSQNDRFGLNSNGYSTATGMPFPYDGIEQVVVELAPFDVTFSGFSACNINAVSKSGTNVWEFGAFYEWTNDSMRGDKIANNAFNSESYTEEKYGFSAGGPIIQDRLFIFGAYEETEEPRFLAGGYAGSGHGEERPWLSEADYNRIVNIANSVYSYDPGGQPTNGLQTNEKYMLRVDWNISDNHNAAVIYNYFDGPQSRASDNDSNEFEFRNHYYTKGAESETITAKLYSQWTDAFSTELYFSTHEMNDSQVTDGPKDFADMQISVGGRTGTVYMGADDSRQANALNYDSDFLKLIGSYLVGDHVITAGYEREELNIFNLFVQHSRGGEYDFFDDSSGNDPACAALTAQQRLDDSLAIGCEPSGIDRFELGRPSRIYYGSGGGTNDANDAAASFSNTLHSIYVQDEMFFDSKDLTVVAGIRYETFESDDRPNFNQTFANANGGLRNDHNIDGLDLVMPRLGFTWNMRDDLTFRGGVGLYAGGNPNVWLSNAWSNDGSTNVQLRNNYFDSATVLPGMADSLPLIGAMRPGFDVPQEMFDEVANTTAANASDSALVLIDPNYEQPSQWKYALGATYDLPWMDITAHFDILHTRGVDQAMYVDLSQTVVGTTTLGQPIYDYTNGEDNFMLTNAGGHSEATLISLVVNKNFDWGLDMQFGYAYTDADDVVPMTSSVAGSNFDNTALLDVNNPIGATSNYVVPHRLTLRASYGAEIFGNNMTRFTVYGFSQEGQPQSYVMGSGDLEGDGFFGRHLLYVPTGLADPNVIFGPTFDVTGFFDFVAREGLGAGFQARNGQHAKWSTRWNLAIFQELPLFRDDLKGKLYFKMYNFGNLLNSHWGRQHDAQFFSIQVVNSSIDGAGRYVYEEFNDRDFNDLLETRSLWEARLGVTFNFN